MCARIGLVTGQGLSGVIRKHCPKWVLILSTVLLIVANLFNIGADLIGMADSAALVTKIPREIWIFVFPIFFVLSLTYLSYRWIARTFKWLTLVLVAYIIVAFIVQPNWGEVLRSTFIPKVGISSKYFSSILAILGTTITPYMFFWQAAQEVEEERAHGHKTVGSRRGASIEELRAARTDVVTGMGWAGLVMYFIILTAGATLHRNGVTTIHSAAEAASALRPLAGDYAYLLFAFGIIGTGILGIPVLAGSAAYALSETFHWHGSLDERPKLSPKFYGVLAVILLSSWLTLFLKIDSMKALFWAAVINGILAPPLVAVITWLSSQKTVMGEHTSGPWLKGLGWLATTVMSLAAIGLLLSFRSN